MRLLRHAIPSSSSREIYDHPAVAALLANNKLRRADAEHALTLKSSSHEPIDQILAKLGLVAERDFGELAAQQTQLPFETQLTGALTAADFEDLNIDFCERHRVLPLQKNQSGYRVAIVDPFDHSATDGAAFAFGGEIEAVVTTDTIWNKLFTAFAAGAMDEAADEDALDVSADADRLKDMASEEPIIRFVNGLVSAAAEARASDIHLEPGEREAQIKFRIDGVLHEHQAILRPQALSVVSRIKILAQLDIAEQRRPQDGRFSYPVAGQFVDLRVSTVPTDHGESLVIRILDQTHIDHNFDALGYTNEQRASIDRLLSKPSGILLVTGPTGSGKTTTLYTMLKQLTDGQRKILTIEDPIEQRLTGVSQTQTNAVIGLTFSSALRAFLRHDPDIIMVGEIRDVETAGMAVQAALTGHLVLSTLHTNDAVSAITRLLDMGVEDYLIASTLNGVIAQRLVRRTCCTCQGDGCGLCGESGFSGRLAIAEVLEMSAPVVDALRQNWSEADVSSALDSDGFIRLRADGVAKAQTGLTNMSEIVRAAGATG